MIRELHLQAVGPAPEISVLFAERMNIFTGDNGLGKTFLLDIIWWALAGTWVNAQVCPQRGKDAAPEISYRLSEDADNPEVSAKGSFDFNRQLWSVNNQKILTDCIVVYVRVDGSFSVCDSARKNYNVKGAFFKAPPSLISYHLTPDNLWNGLEVGKKVLCNGLIRDWVAWQNHPDQSSSSPFSLLSNVIERLSPHPDEWMKPGKPTRVSIDDVRDIPTVELPYGVIPVTQVSAGMKRILGLAYLLVWTWYEHLQASELLNSPPANSIILLIDEVESHLHPQWQRSILPAVLDVAKGLKATMQTQVIATTHSPLVLASVEPEFDESIDKLFLFSLDKGQVQLQEQLWAQQGDAVGWLVSDVFGLKQARSKEAEIAIEAAEAFMRGEVERLPESLRTRDEIHRELQRVVPGHDPFWPRWIVSTKAGLK